MTNTLLGIPIEGDIVSTEKRPHQKPIEDLLPLLQAVLDDENVKQFGWRQYTPYYNDGEPCTFSAWGAWAIPADWIPSEAYDEDDYDDDAFDIDYSEHWYNKQDKDWYRNREANLKPQYKETMPKLKALNQAIDDGNFDDVLLEKFGDHAKVTVTKEKIQVEYYEHD